jgi:hypothetical protein
MSVRERVKKIVNLRLLMDSHYESHSGYCSHPEPDSPLDDEVVTICEVPIECTNWNELCVVLCTNLDLPNPLLEIVQTFAFELNSAGTNLLNWEYDSCPCCSYSNSYTRVYQCLDILSPKTQLSPTILHPIPRHIVKQPGFADHTIISVQPRMNEK